MSEHMPGEGSAESRDERSPEGRAADHAAIDRLAHELLPALVVKLAATGLGELEVREGTWKVRLRRPADGSGRSRRGADRPSRTQPGHAGHGHAPAALEGHRPARLAGASDHSTNGNSPGPLAPVGPGRYDDDDERAATDPHRAIATSPAVGIFQPRSDIQAGTRVRTGDRVASVDVLGVPQEVVSPADGIVGATLVEAGEAVEYGQELIVIELVTAPSATGEGEPGMEA